MMEWKKELKILSLFTFIFLAFYYIPLGEYRFEKAIIEAFSLVKWYAREHVILCLIPAFFIAGAMAVFISKASVIKYLGAKAKKIVSYGMASISGTILAVCSCTVLPLFAGIYRMGAGIGPASTFLYSGPAINVLAIILTTSVLGLELGIARAVGAIVFSIIIGLFMAAIFRKDEKNIKADLPSADIEDDSRSLRENVVFFLSLIGILVFSNWGKPQNADGFWLAIYQNKWLLTSASAVLLVIMLLRWLRNRWIRIMLLVGIVVFLSVLLPENHELIFTAGVIGLVFVLFKSGETGDEWLTQTWDFTKQIVPLLFIGVFVAGFLLGRPGHAGVIPESWISGFVGENTLFANFFASFSGAFMYFATLTEVPILQGLIGAGMHKGPALALLLAGPALSLPNMLVIRSIIGTKKTIVFIILVVIMATISGLIFGGI